MWRGLTYEDFTRFDREGEAIVMVLEGQIDLWREHPEIKLVQVPVVLIYKNYRGFIRIVMIDCYYGIKYRDLKIDVDVDKILKTKKLSMFGIEITLTAPIAYPYPHRAKFAIYDIGKPSEILYKIYTEHIVQGYDKCIQEYGFLLPQPWELKWYE